jgi:N-acetylglutamate synthase-like GNAT family acetyltransferase
LRLAYPEEAQEAVDWIGQHDPEALYTVGFKNTMTVKLEGEASIYSPIQVTFMVEALGIQPNTRKRYVVKAIMKLLEGVKSLARGLEMGEIYFVGTNPEFNRQAEVNGFELVPFPVYRLKVKP